MPDRTRPIRKEICLNEQELSLIQHKMRQLGTHNFGAYARKMLIDGYIIKVDYTEQKKLAAAVSRIAANINQIGRRINSTGRCYEDDVAELKARQAEIWDRRPRAARIVVVLPAPFAPTRPTTSPSPTARLTPSRAKEPFTRRRMSRPTVNLSIRLSSS